MNGLISVVCMVCLLALCAPVPRGIKDTSAGIKIQLGVNCSEGENARQLLVRYLGPGKIWLNDYPFNEAGLRLEIAKIMESMKNKRVWIAADERVSYGEVFALIANLQRAVPDLTIGIATKSQTGPVDPAEYVVQRDKRGHPYTLEPMPPCFIDPSLVRP